MSWVTLFLGLLLGLPAGAMVPVVDPGHGVPDQHLDAVMAVTSIPATGPGDPESFWNAPERPVRRADGTTHWVVHPGERLVGRVVLQPQRGQDVYVVQVPVSQVDRVQVWYRGPGRPWQGAEAGDRVPLTRWPFLGQFPAFPLPTSEAPLDVVVAVANSARMELPVLVKNDRSYREERLLQANLLGVVLGLGLMGAAVCLVTALTFRNRASWVLFAYATWAFVMVATMSGYTAIWLTPEWPEFNDRSKHVTGVVMAGLLFAVIVETLDELSFWPVTRWLGGAVVAASVFYGMAQALWLPDAWRPAGGLGWAAACVATGAGLCFVSWLRGGRHVGLVTIAMVMGVLVVVLVAAFARGVGGVHFSHLFDVRTIGTAVFLFASAQVLRHTLFRRERYGRDVLGRAAIAANRDPLTALLSYIGLQHAYEEATLRQAAGRGPVAIMMLALPGFDQSAVDHGFILTERALVRFAATLQLALGNEWSTGRLTKTRFCAVSNSRAGAAGLMQEATRILSHCSRLHDPLSPVADFDLRIVCTYRQEAVAPFKELLRVLEEAGQALEPTKRIALV